MAKHIPKTLTLTKLTSSLFLSKNPSKPSPISLSSRFLSHRNFHTKAQLTDPDSDPSSSAASSGAGFIFSDDIEGELGFRTLSEAIQYVMVRNAAPDWLPFMPGSSYWVPPKRKMQNKFLEVVGEFVDPMTMEESLSLRSSRGWPCSEVLLDRGSIYEDPIGVKEEMQMHAQTRPERTSPEDED